MTLEQALDYVWNGRAVLFLGAGFSSGALNVNAKGFLTGARFATYLATKAGLPEDLALEEIAEAYVHAFGEDSLIDELFNEFTASSVTPAQRYIAEAPWRRVYTTNYDNVFETACTQAMKTVRSVAPTENIEKVAKSGLLCIHLNGSIQTISRESLWGDLKLTGSSYDSSPLSDSPWTGLFRSDLRAAQAVFFLGYSMWDLDIRRLAAEEDLKDKCFFVLGKSPDPSTKYRTERFGCLLELSTNAFAESLKEAASHHGSKVADPPVAFCVERYSPANTSLSLEDRFVFDLLLFGRLRGDLLPSSVSSSRKYVADRDSDKAILDRISIGTRCIVLHSSLGNGKTADIELLKYRAFQAGFVVFVLRNRGESLDEELQNAISIAGKKVIFVDNYPEWMDVLKVLGSYSSEDFRVVVTARSTTNDVLVTKLLSNLRTEDLYEVDLNILSDAELAWISSYFDEYGLWGTLTAESRHRKMRYLRKDCGGEWQGILLGLLEAPNIIDKLRDLFAAFKRGGVYQETLLCLLALGVMGFHPSKNDAADLCGDQIFEGGFKKDQVVNELIEFGRDCYSSRSSITAKYLLQRVTDPNSVVSAIVSLLRRADEKYAVSFYHRLIFRQVLRFSNLSHLFSEADRGRATMSIYEKIKNFSRIKNAPLFWLQYAIAALFAKDFTRSDSYFKVAYAHAGGLDNYDTYQIDNHYARFLIARAIHRHDVDGAMSAFRESRKLLYQQLATDRRHYPFRVASTWSDFYSAFEAELDDDSRLELRRAAAYVANRIEQLTTDQHEPSQCSRLLGKNAETFRGSSES